LHSRYVGDRNGDERCALITITFPNAQTDAFANTVTYKSTDFFAHCIVIANFSSNAAAVGPA
jgi:hypothetical protein